MSQEKSFWNKNLEIKPLVKRSQFSEFLGQNVTVNKVLRLRFLKKKVLILGKMRSSLRRFNKKDFSSLHVHILYSQGCFYYQAPFFHGCKHSLFPCIFYYKRVFFHRTFSVLKFRTLFPKTFFQINSRASPCSFQHMNKLIKINEFEYFESLSRILLNFYEFVLEEEITR